VPFNFFWLNDFNGLQALDSAFSRNNVQQNYMGFQRFARRDGLSMQQGCNEKSRIEAIREGLPTLEIRTHLTRPAQRAIIDEDAFQAELQARERRLLGLSALSRSCGERSHSVLAWPSVVDEQHKIAEKIVAHLESTNWKIEKGPPVEGHGQYIIPPR
jgi:hypothetical protein